MSVCCLQQLCRRLLQQLQLIIPPRLFSLQQKKKKYLIHIKTFCFLFFSFSFCKYFYFYCRCVSENGDVSASLGFCSLLGFFVNKNSFLNCFFYIYKLAAKTDCHSCLRFVLAQCLSKRASSLF